MPSTTNFGLRYPALGDAPNVPQDMQNLASDVDTLLTGYHGYYRQEITGQSILNSTDTKVTFNFAVPTVPLGIEYSAGVFTIKKAGMWTLRATVCHKWYSASTTTSAWLGPSSATTTRWVLDTRLQPSTSPPVNDQPVHLTHTREFALNETFALWTWHNEGSARALSVTYGGMTKLEAEYKGAK